MIIEKLIKIELEAENNINIEFKRIEAIKSVRKFLNQIDFSVEIIPLEDSERLTNLFASLKGEKLNAYEAKLVDEITKK